MNICIFKNGNYDSNNLVSLLKVKKQICSDYDRTNKKFAVPHWGTI